MLVFKRNMQSLWFILAVVVASLGVSVADPVDFYKDCGSKTGKIQTVDITPACGDDRFCIFQSGKHVNLAWTIKAQDTIKAMTARVFGTIAGIPVPFPLPNANACKNSNVTCPVKAGDTFTYNLDLEVKEMYPKIHVDVKFQLIDDDHKNVGCFTLPAKIE